jgi:hypothetical protein
MLHGMVPEHHFQPLHLKTALYPGHNKICLYRNHKIAGPQHLSVSESFPCIYVEVKQSHNTPTEAQGGRVVIILLTTSSLDEGEWSASRPGRALPPVPTGQEAGWAPESVWIQRSEEKSSCLCRASNLDCPVVQSVVRHYTDWPTPAPVHIRTLT